MTADARIRVLLVEDHNDLAGTIVDFLESFDFTVDYAADGLTGLHLARTRTFDAIVLDVMLPGIDGLELCRRLRAEHACATPVIVLTARDELNDKLAGFDSGADDYLVKPFDLPELVARLRSLVRRGTGAVTGERLSVADLTLDTGSREVHRAGRALALSPTAFRILELLVRQAPNVVTRKEIEWALWGEEPPRSDSLRSLVYKLRGWVDGDADAPLLHTVTGIGYRLAAPGAPGAPGANEAGNDTGSADS